MHAPVLIYSILIFSIVLVPGLGAHPEDTWKSPKGFNWTTSEDALIKCFPKARVLLFMYESAWFGALKVKSQIMSNISKTLLLNLQSKRKVSISRKHLPQTLGSMATDSADIQCSSTARAGPSCSLAIVWEA